MTCTCPKCKAAIEFDAETIPAEGSFDKCSACNASLVIRKESFAKRSLYKSTDIACAECGSSPGTSIFCESCHAIYPDILAIETTSAAKKQLGKLIASLNLLKQLKPKTHAKSHIESIGSVSAPGKARGKGKGISLPGRAQLAAGLVILLIAIGLGGYFWYQDRIATRYAENFVRSLLVMKMARDLEIGVSNRVVTSWRSGGGSTLTPAELKSTATGKKDVETLLSRFGEVPKKFTATNDALNRLSNNFGQLHAIVTAPSGTSDVYLGEVKKKDDEFMKAARELQSALPEKVADTLNTSKKKHKSLQEI